MKKRNASIVLVFASVLAAFAGAAPPAFAQLGATNAPFWTGMKDRRGLRAGHGPPSGVHAKVVLDQMIAITKGKQTIENTLRPYDNVLLELDAVSSQAQLVQSVHAVEGFPADCREGVAARR